MIKHWWDSWVSPYDSGAIWHLFQKLTCPVTHGAPTTTRS